jgi:hypothetical protein
MQSIGSFAENLINEQVKDIKAGKVAPPIQGGQPQVPAGRDISNVEVPDDFMHSILGEQYTPPSQPEVQPEVQQEHSIVEEVNSLLTEETANQLITLLMEVKTLLKEMGTTSGALGVNLGGKGCSTSKSVRGSDGYIKPTAPAKRPKRKQTAKDILKRYR